MTVFGWVVVGLVAGVLARLATQSEKEGCLGTLVVGILGALIGGALFRLVTGEETDVFDEGLNLSSILVAFVGAAALLLVLQATGVRSRRGGRPRWGRPPWGRRRWGRRRWGRRRW